MKRKYVWLIACAIALLLSFLIPWIVLFAMERNSMGKVEQLDVSGELVGYGELSVTRKQQLLGTGELIVSADPTLDTQEQQQLITAFRAETALLTASGALPDFISDLASEQLTARCYLALHAESSEAFRYFELTNESGNICGLYDAEQGKILGIEIRYLTDIYVSFTVDNTTGTAEASFTEQLRAWANYYGHVADEISVQTEKGPFSEEAYVVKSNFSQGEYSYSFGLLYESSTERFAWGVLPSEAQEAEEVPVT